jgi:diguanylate cyclase (GGDEF)-like protein
MSIAGWARRSTGNGAKQDFWRQQTRVALSVVLVETAIVMTYLAATPHGTHRLALWIVTASCFVVGLASLVVVVPIQLSEKWELTFSLGWSLATCVIVAAGAALDGGLRSPLLILLVFPVVFAGLILPPASVALTAFSSVVAASVACATGSTITADWPAFLIDLAVLVGLSTVSFAASAGRTGLQLEADRLTNELASLATTDTLTGCLNRRAFDEQCELEFLRSARYGHRLAFIMIDIDNFKGLNDTSGHLAGDRALARVGETLRGTSRSIDIVARYGGDEFAILMPDTDVGGVVGLASRIRRELAFDDEYSLTLSYGGSLVGANISTLATLSEEADWALYEAKRAGRDRIVVRDNGMSNTVPLTTDKSGQQSAPTDEFGKSTP